MASITIRNLDDEVHIENGDVLDIIRHPNASRYPNQRVIVLNVEGYVYLVPYVEQKGTRFLKTIIPKESDQGVPQKKSPLKLDREEVKLLQDFERRRRCSRDPLSS